MSIIEKLKLHKNYRILLTSFIAVNSLVLFILTFALDPDSIYKTVIIYLSVICFIFSIINLVKFFITSRKSNLVATAILIEFPVIVLIGVGSGFVDLSVALLYYLVATSTIVIGALGVILMIYQIFVKKNKSYIYIIFLILSFLCLIFGMVLCFLNKYMDNVAIVLLRILFASLFVLSFAFLIGLIVLKVKFKKKYVNIKQDIKDVASTVLETKKEEEEGAKKE